MILIIINVTIRYSTDGGKTWLPSDDDGTNITGGTLWLIWKKI